MPTGPDSGSSGSAWGREPSTEGQVQEPCAAMQLHPLVVAALYELREPQQRPSNTHAVSRDDVQTWAARYDWDMIGI